MEYIESKTILSPYKINNNWFGYNYNMNIYKGCCHGCIYCDSRSECYNIEDFDKVRAKKNAIGILNSELKSKRKKGVVATGAMSDPYNTFEKEYEFTRKALKLINKYNFGVSIATKSNLITRDIDILKKIKTHSPALTKMTVTTADDKLSKILEPNVCESSKRFEAINKLSSNGIYTGILLMPILPFIEDTEDNIVSIISLAKENGAKFIYPAFGVTLRQNQREYFFTKVDRYFKNMSNNYIKEYGNSYRCGSKNARKLWYIFKKECDKSNILYKMEDIIKDYKKEYEITQLSLF
ncbi:SPL family radical SAM protein [Clostridium oceanicum]|uniref:Radical SAM protein n=1 Tax=Clostridium oceanicum TaxID=1543 RepID=A0ABP3UEU4_9CLOT